MTNKRLCLPDGNDQNKEGEENQENAFPTTFVMYSNAERCPICLNCLLEQEVGSPENCHHVFCITCILKWAEVVPFCPVDRKPFQAVYRLEDNVKFQVPQIVNTLEKEGVACKNSSCCTVECPFAIRDTGVGPIDAKNINFYEKHSSCIENKKKASKIFHSAGKSLLNFYKFRCHRFMLRARSIH